MIFKARKIEADENKEIAKVLGDMKQAATGVIEYYAEVLTGILIEGGDKLVGKAAWGEPSRRCTGKSG